jgi:hypothetical protein
MLLKVSKSAMDGLSIQENWDEIAILTSIDVIVIVLSGILFPYMKTLKKARAENCRMIFLVYTVWQGFLGQVPRQAILNETVRNLYFHVTMWFSMIFLLATSVVHSIRGHTAQGKS